MIAFPRINVQAFGAKGDGVTDDSAAILAAVNAALSMGSAPQGTWRFLPPVFFPGGNYVITTPQTFNPFISPGSASPQMFSVMSINGLSFIGEAYGGVQITYNNTGGGWLFNNTNVAQLPTFRNLIFQGVSGKELGMYFASTVGGRVYGAHFEDCDFYNFAQALYFGGTQMTSENRFLRCGLYAGAGQTAITINNPQSVNYGFDCLNAQTNGGTIINLLGGGFINIRNLNAILTAGAFLQTAGPSSSFGQNNDGIFIEGAKTELWGAQLAVIRNGFHCTIRDSNLNPVAAVNPPVTAANAHLVAANGSTIRMFNDILGGNVTSFADARSSIVFDQYCNPTAQEQAAN
jgi:hypothetical protein